MYSIENNVTFLQQRNEKENIYFYYSKYRVYTYFTYVFIFLLYIYISIYLSLTLDFFNTRDHKKFLPNNTISKIGKKFCACHFRFNHVFLCTNPDIPIEKI